MDSMLPHSVCVCMCVSLLDGVCAYEGETVSVIPRGGGEGGVFCEWSWSAADSCVCLCFCSVALTRCLLPVCIWLGASQLPVWPALGPRVTSWQCLTSMLLSISVTCHLIPLALISFSSSPFKVEMLELANNLSNSVMSADTTLNLKRWKDQNVWPQNVRGPGCVWHFLFGVKKAVPPWILFLKKSHLVVWSRS